MRDEFVPTPADRFRVVGGDKLLADSGGSDAVCDEIRRVAAAIVPNKRFSVEVRILGSSWLAVTLVTEDGTTLREQCFC